ncbi:NEDD4 family-interacting protein 1-like [Saccoglossus kowalevskii]|uniref:NEDD4 family-interacting protein 1-like n=1 Tax=Saccoglossus kowalevskii TaxID=10224 RepID=A0ABM0GXX4_SACKO|nr:PREDICTED: NEDD4 family-interacting protein 1-like [Saccoglossus kowalevskii]
MDQPPKYEELHIDDDDDEDSSAVIMALVVPPPSPEDTRPSTPVPPEDPKDDTDPPPYNIASTLPSYDDVQKQKDTEPLMNQDPEAREHDVDMDLGGDVMFICTFIIAFIFNWVGLLFSFCMTTTVAGRYGAISGFGLSIIKWVVIMMHTASLTDYVDTLPCLWWILLLLGMMLFLRGAVMYIKVKRQFTTGVRTRFSYFYIY